MARAGVKPEQIAPDDRRLLIDLYDSAIRYTSDQVARLFDGLDESGLWDETAVILTADHGEEFGEHGRYFHRNRPYDELLHVPMFLRTPEMDTSTTVDADRELLDVAPTVCRLHGVDAPEEFLGAALRDSRERRPIATGSFRDDGPVVGARWDGWKYIDVDGVPELFDLGDDPGEQTNVAAEHPAVCRRYRDRIPDALLETEADGVPDASDVDSETQRRLEELGYLE
jgi:arylsulfatase A-like enzyme